MIKPAAFGYNAETADSNVFQKKINLSAEELQKKAVHEFEQMVSQLKNAEIEIFVLEDLNKKTPDSVFPNNWISFHEDGTVILYPLLSSIRRKERRTDIAEQLRKYFHINRIIDLTMHEEENKFLEGTGSIVFDHENKMAYAAISPRTDQQLFEELCSALNYKAIHFNSFDKNGIAIYHTNVMMALAEKFAIVCLESIVDENERNKVLTTLKISGKEIIVINLHQMENFAGNAFSVKNKKGESFLIISERAVKSLTYDQKNKILKTCRLITPSVETIENTGGGSVRCMISEINLPRLIT